MPPVPNPSETARETLRQLALRRITPTPENYRQIYHEIAGTPLNENQTGNGRGHDGSKDSGSGNDGLRQVLSRLPRGSAEQQRLVRQLEQTLTSGNEAQTLQALDQYFELIRTGDSLAWNELIANLLRAWESRHQGWTTARKRESLDRVLQTGEPLTLYNRLQGLLRGWSQTAAETDPALPLATGDLPAGVTSSSLPAASGTPLPPGLELLPALRQLLSAALSEVIPSFVGAHPDLSREIEQLATQAGQIENQRHIETLAQRMRQLAHRLEMVTADDAEIRAGLLELLRLLLRNIDELVLDDKWFAGQIQMLRELVDTPPNPRTLDDAGRRLKELIYKQSQLKHNLIQTQLQLRSMLAGFVDQLANFSQSTGSYHDRIGSCAQRIANANEISEIAPLIDEVMRETRSIQEETLRSRKELDATRQQVETAEQRIVGLQRELDEASRMMRHDQLTGILNRRGLEEMFEAESARARRRHSTLAIGLLDIDNFKKLNDTHGHQVGDQALVHLAEVIRRHLRPQDVFARYGGEEFVILLPEAETEEAYAVLTRLQRELTREFFMADQQRLVITFSAGLSLVAEGEGMQPALERADAAMYEAKQAGRNRVVIAAIDQSAGDPPGSVG